MHALKTGINTDKFTTFWCFRKGFITHSFANDPCTLPSSERKYTRTTDSKTHENV